MLIRCALLFVSVTFAVALDPSRAFADQPTGAPSAREEEAKKKHWEEMDDAKLKADTTWMMMSTALVLLMVPGLALFYGGMVRRKNILATMMQSMVALAVIGVFWVAIGYALAFGQPVFSIDFAGFKGSIIGFRSEFVFMHGVRPDEMLPGTNIPVYLHMLYQGMFAIITPALISGAVAERIRFRPYCLFLILWIVLVYCPLAHNVWAMNWWSGTRTGTENVGVLGVMGALDFAGGTVVHIAAGLSGLAAILVLRKRLGYPEHAMHPNSMVLCLTGAGILWFGWFGFNGGSGLTSGGLATSAFAATQCAAAAAGLSWLTVEWLHRGKPTALGLASGIVAGLVAVTPASGYVLPWGGCAIGFISGIVCYISVSMKPVFRYDDSLDAFGVHGVGGFLGAVLTGVFCYEWDYVNPSVGKPGLIASGSVEQVWIQLKAAIVSAVLAFVISLILVKAIDLLIGFIAEDREEIEGLDRTEHGETGFDFGYGYEVAPVMAPAEPRAAIVPPTGSGRFQIVVEGIQNGDLMHAWSTLCLPTPEPSPEFKAIYPYVTTVQGNRFRFRGGDQEQMKDNLQKLFERELKRQLKVKVEV
ncbi:MAG TPA: ammonium transporter [Gemmataceae bacterium]|nr:ammonium transporter [Gemmataceae bacterium]